MRSRLYQLNSSFIKSQLFNSSSSYHLRNVLNRSSCNPLVIICDGTRSIATKKYRVNPPIDLKKVRTVTLESPDDDDENSNRPTYGFVLLVIPLLTFGLGCWQVKRREWKLDLIKFLEDRTTTEPNELPTSQEDLFNLRETKEFYPFKVKGRFIHEKEVLQAPKHDITGTNPLPGGLIITPFVVSGRDNLTILVNRGYVPYTHYTADKRKEGQIETEVELVGLCRNDEIISTFTPPNKPPTEWHWREIERFANTLETAPVWLDATRESSVRGGPLGGQTAINLRNEHMSYIVTWYTLSFLTSLMWWKKFGRLLFK